MITLDTSPEKKTPRKIMDLSYL